MRTVFFLILALLGATTAPTTAPSNNQIDAKPWPAGDITSQLYSLKSNTHYHTIHAAKYTFNCRGPLPAVTNVTISGDDSNTLNITLTNDVGTGIDAINTDHFSMSGFYITLPTRGNVFNAGVASHFGPNVICVTCQHWFVATYPTGNYSVCDGLSSQNDLPTMGQAYFNVGCDECWCMNNRFPISIGEDKGRRVRGNEVHKGMDDGHEGIGMHVWNNTFVGPSAIGKTAWSDRVGKNLDMRHNHFVHCYIRIGEDDPGHATSSNVYIAYNIFEPNKTISGSYPISQIDYKCKNDGAVIDHNIFNTTQRQQPIACTGQDVSVFKSLNGNMKHSTDGSTPKSLVSFWQSGKNSDGTNIVSQ